MAALVVPEADGGVSVPSDDRGEARPATVWLSEAIVGGLVLVVSLVAWVSLALADLGAHSLAAVAATTACLAVAVAGAVLGLRALSAARRRPPREPAADEPGEAEERGETVASGEVPGSSRRRVRIRVDPAGLVMIAGIAALAGFFFFPGFAYGAADKDPGGYVAHGMEIARTGGYSLRDPASDPSRVPDVEMASPGARFPGVWISHDDVVVPQFYALWPALLATAADIGGEHALTQVAPLCGLLAVCTLTLVVRRAVTGALGGAAPPGAARAGSAAGGADRAAADRAAATTGAAAAEQMTSRCGRAERTWAWFRLVGRTSSRYAGAAGLFAGAATGALLATNMLQVWQAKYPSSEISAQMLFVGALFGVVLALATGSWPPAAMAGVLAGIGFLDRADGMLTLLLAAAAGAVLVAVRRFDRRAVAFAAGLGAVLPHALWQAYSPDANRDYTLINGIPDLPVIAGIVGTLFAAGLLARPVVGRMITSRAARQRHTVSQAERNRRIQLVTGLGVLLVVAGLFALGVLRGRLFGADYKDFEGLGRQRTYDEQSLDRLAWFVSRPAFLLAFAGLAVVALRRWNAMLWAVVLSTLPLLAVYAWHTHNSVRLMWWARRYVPVALPGLLALAGIALGVALAALTVRRLPPRLVVGLPAATALGGLLAFALPQSLPLRHHHEMGGSFAVTAELAALADGREGVYLWPREPCCLTESDLFPAALWLGRGQLSALLPGDESDWPDYVADFFRGFPDSPVFVIGSGADRPRIPGVGLVAARRIVTSLPFWEERETSRPDHATSIPVDFTVWRVLRP
ncbi:hypothetical protein [Pseudofrankia sp. BMG5.36]|uniref:hypothetical protein n=1 Tax=Pseudofrankia sp. BMG5.36 TaxID=1834512 RepID=UPI000AFFA217|nr:hypothetical protein [Pseudofrankia sp. BMG5.36]